MLDLKTLGLFIITLNLYETLGTAAESQNTTTTTDFPTDNPIFLINAKSLNGNIEISSLEILPTSSSIIDTTLNRVDSEKEANNYAETNTSASRDSVLDTKEVGDVINKQSELESTTLVDSWLRAENAVGEGFATSGKLDTRGDMITNMVEEKTEGIKYGNIGEISKFSSKNASYLSKTEEPISANENEPLLDLSSYFKLDPVVTDSTDISDREMSDETIEDMQSIFNEQINADELGSVKESGFKSTPNLTIDEDILTSNVTTLNPKENEITTATVISVVGDGTTLNYFQANDGLNEQISHTEATTAKLSSTTNPKESSSSKSKNIDFIHTATQNRSEVQFEITTTEENKFKNNLEKNIGSEYNSIVNNSTDDIVRNVYFDQQKDGQEGGKDGYKNKLMERTTVLSEVGWNSSKNNKQDTTENKMSSVSSITEGQNNEVSYGNEVTETTELFLDVYGLVTERNKINTASSLKEKQEKNKLMETTTISSLVSENQRPYATEEKIKDAFEITSIMGTLANDTEFSTVSNRASLNVESPKNIQIDIDFAETTTLTTKVHLLSNQIVQIGKIKDPANFGEISQTNKFRNIVLNSGYSEDPSITNTESTTMLRVTKEEAGEYSTANLMISNTEVTTLTNVISTEHESINTEPNGFITLDETVSSAIEHISDNVRSLTNNADSKFFDYAKRIKDITTVTTIYENQDTIENEERIMADTIIDNPGYDTFNDTVETFKNSEINNIDSTLDAYPADYTGKESSIQQSTLNSVMKNALESQVITEFKTVSDSSTPSQIEEYSDYIQVISKKYTIKPKENSTEKTSNSDPLSMSTISTDVMSTINEKISKRKSTDNIINYGTTLNPVRFVNFEENEPQSSDENINQFATDPPSDKTSEKTTINLLFINNATEISSSTAITEDNIQKFQKLTEKEGTIIPATETQQHGGNVYLKDTDMSKTEELEKLSKIFTEEVPETTWSEESVFVTTYFPETESTETVTTDPETYFSRFRNLLTKGTSLLFHSEDVDSTSNNKNISDSDETTTEEESTSRLQEENTELSGDLSAFSGEKLKTAEFQQQTTMSPFFVEKVDSSTDALVTTTITNSNSKESSVMKIPKKGRLGKSTQEVALWPNDASSANGDSSAHNKRIDRFEGVNSNMLKSNENSLEREEIVVVAKIFNNDANFSVIINNKANSTRHIRANAFVFEKVDMFNITWKKSDFYNNSLVFYFTEKEDYYLINKLQYNYVNEKNVLEGQTQDITISPNSDSVPEIVLQEVRMFISNVDFLWKIKEITENEADARAAAVKERRIWHIEVALMCIAVVTALSLILLFVVKKVKAREMFKVQNVIPEISRC